MNFVMRRRGYTLARKICKGSKGMTNIELVIKIPEDLYSTIKKNGYIYEEEVEDVALSIIGGTPLQKGHGRLIDTDVLEPDSCGEWNGLYVTEDTYKQSTIDNAPTIIKADKEERGDKECI